MPTQLIIKPGANRNNTYAVPGTDTIYTYKSGSALTVTVPSNGEFVLFSATDDFYVRWDGGTASVPTGNVVDGTGSEANPIVRDVKPSQTFSIIGADANTIVTMSFYR